MPWRGHSLDYGIQFFIAGIYDHSCLVLVVVKYGNGILGTVMCFAFGNSARAASEAILTSRVEIFVVLTIKPRWDWDFHTFNQPP